MSDDLEADLFAFFCAKYVQRADDRQKSMGLQYTEAETHDLARTVARWLAARAQGPGLGEAVAWMVTGHGCTFFSATPPSDKPIDGAVVTPLYAATPTREA